MLIFTITVYSYGCEYMKRIWRCFLFECKMAFKNFFRYFGLSLSAMMSVTVTLVLISIFLIITANLGNVTYHMEDEIIIRATIDQVLEKTQIDTLKNKIKLLENVKDIQYFTGAEELAEYKKSMLPYLIGAFLVFAISTIVSVIMQFTNELFPTT